MAQASTVIKGTASNEPCLRKAACLILDVYDYSNSEVSLTMQPMLQSARADWEKIFDNQQASGYRAVLYRRKGNEADREKGALCPPALVFRGSDSTEEEYRGIAASVEVDWSAKAGITGIYSQGPAGMQKFEYVFSPNPAVRAMKRSELTSAGFQETRLIDRQSGSIQLPSKAIGIEEGDWFKLPTEASASWTASASIWTKDEGDWATNIRQGMGLRTVQYAAAIRDGLKAADIALGEWDGHLMVLGHSLGGGLAAAAACAAQHKKPGIKLVSRVFNAAGLHANTVSELGATPSSAAVQTNSVEDEILTTLQASSCPIPLVGQIFRWTGQKMPATTPSPAVRAAPGYPKLWPVNVQTLDPSMSFKELIAAENIARGSSALSDFARRYAETTWSRSDLNSMAAFTGLKTTLETEGRNLMKLALKSVEYHLIPAVCDAFPSKVGA